jgi:hypothetical protein
VGFFDTPAVKDLKKCAQLIGILYGQAHTGTLSEADRDDAVYNGDLKDRLRISYAAASREIGASRALRAATNSARDECDTICRESSRRHVVANAAAAGRAAEQAILDILQTRGRR